MNNYLNLPKKHTKKQEITGEHTEFINLGIRCEKLFPMTMNTVREEEKVKMPFPIKIYRHSTCILA